MLKISLWLKKPKADQANLEHITISSPEKVLEGRLAGFYACEVSLPEIVRIEHPFFSDNPIETLILALECAKIYLQSLIFRGYTISEVENGELWKLQKKDPQVSLQEKLSDIKNNPDIPSEVKNKILGIFSKAECRLKKQ